jgi:hypothetical protein
MTWEHTTGQNLHDTPSGDLEVGDYAVQPNGAYIANPLPFVSSTSTSGTGRYHADDDADSGNSVNDADCVEFDIACRSHHIDFYRA